MLAHGTSEQRPAQAAAGKVACVGNTGQAIHAGTAQQVQEHRLKLVVFMVGGQQPLAAAGVPCRSAA